MKPRSKFIASLLLASAFAAANAFAGSSAVCFTAATQQGVGKGPIAVPRDPELEKQSARNLEVAKYYFYKRKPEKKDQDGWLRLNKAVESRLTEILDTNPNYARMIEVYFMLGEVYHRMGDLDKASEYWNKAVKEDSDEKIKAEAQKRLDESKTKDKK
jgi:Tfp pilus assembly protein PilF